MKLNAIPRNGSVQTKKYSWSARRKSALNKSNILPFAARLRQYIDKGGALVYWLREETHLQEGNLM